MLQVYISLCDILYISSDIIIHICYILNWLEFITYKTKNIQSTEIYFIIHFIITKLKTCIYF